MFSVPTAAQGTAAVQDAAAGTATTAVLASPAGGGVRFTSPGQVSQMSLAVYNAEGALVFDSGLRKGSVLDWKPSEASQPMADGAYLAVVTYKDFQGKLSQRVGALSLQSGQATLKRARREELTAAQTQALAASRQSQKIEAAEGFDSLTVVTEGKERAVTVATHDGQDGQVTSTSGALTFRTGDIIAGADKEQVRITPEGRVGIGTDKPEATLDVAGTVRARGGIVFEDGTVLKSAKDAGGTLNATSLTAITNAGDTTPTNVAGTGTSGRLAKWLETGGAGTLGDSAITESGGNVGIGTASPTTRLEVSDSQTGAGTPFVINNTAAPVGGAFYGLFQGLAPNMGNNDSAYVAFGKTASTNNRAYFSYNHAGNGSPNNRLTFGFFGADNLFNVLANGNVGVGTTAPAQKLDVAGNIRMTGAGNGIIFPDGTKLTTATGGGGTPTGTSIVGAINDPATSGFISDARLSPNVARLNGANAWSGANVFGAGLSANNSLVTNVGNPVNAGDAVNKAYTDANFIKFVPGAEQLSVGDANGTAPMINLRGGSTCCSGPGGHTPAFFKVFQNGSMVVTGNLGIGVSPMQGKGYRTSWDSYKGAFRSGYADNEWDDANVGFFSWAGGSNSTAIGLYALAFGDTNSAESTSSIVFGSGNQVKGAAGFSAGAGNRVCDTYGVALGNNARSGGPYINGRCDPETFNIRGLAAVAIGYNVTADQDHTTAMGKFASNNGFQGTFIWSDGAPQASADTFRNTANNEFAARATGGFRFRTNLGGTTGCNLPAGSGVFNCTSSRTTKENFFDVNGEDVLARLRKIPVTTWNYISEGGGARHLGPMAEDFYGAFRLGTSDKAIGVQDLAGVSLAGVKALDERTARLQASNEQLNLGLQQKTAEVEQLRTQLNTLEQRLAAIEHKMSAESHLEESQQQR
ncbi:MAG TPA: tail fiber domain-containing protein [Pyrinomonadaceae bacterium]|nr:tail fiber domain-containing protein [Pyrinomonadaceae bacterium]